MGFLQFCMRRRGSVSIFLAIILLPVLTVAGLLVDLANRNLSKAVVESAGELAASSALANYDTVLADVYGLFALSQSETDLSENLSRYFADTLDAAGLLQGDGGLESETLKAVQTWAADALGAVTAEDLGPKLMDVQMTNVTAAGVPASALSEPDMLQGQIVEFMKYRGIAEVGLDLLDAVNALKTVSDKADVTDAEMDVQEAVSDLGDVVGDFYKKIVACDRKVKKVQEALANGGWDEYGLDGALTQSLQNANRMLVEAAFRAELEEDLFSLQQGSDGVFRLYQITLELDGTEPKQPLTSPAAVSSPNDALEKIDALREQELRTDKSHWPLYTEADAGSVIQAHYRDNVRPWVKSLGKLTDVALGIHEKMAGLDPDADADELSRWNSALQTAESTLINSMTAFHEQMNFALAYARETLDIRQDFCTYARFANDRLQPIYTAILDIGADIRNNDLTGAIDAGALVLDQFDALGNATAALNTAADNYAEKASEDDYYAGVKSETKNLDESCNAEAVQEVIDQLTAVRAYLYDRGEEGEWDYYGCSGQKQLVEGGFYARSLVKEGGMTYADFEEIFWDAKAQLEREPDFQRDDAAVLAYAKKHVTLKTSEKKNSPVDASRSVYLKQICQALTAAEDGISVGVPKYYIYLLNTCAETADESEAGSDESAKSTGQKLAEEAVAKLDEKTPALSYNAGVFDALDAAAGTDPEGNPLGGVDASSKTGLLKKLKNMLATFKTMTSGLDKAAEMSRDTLFTTQYIFENFSNFAMTTAEYRAAQHVESGKFFQTMTNVDISDKNNALYGCEVEYILYGYRGDSEKEGSGPQQNVDSARNRIFTIRFVCNSIFALSDSLLRAYTTPPALAIQAATLGVFPYQVARVVLQLCLALAETIYDMTRIMDGVKVVFLKDRSTWLMSPDGAAQALLKKGAETAVDQLANLASQQAVNATQNLSTAMQNYVNNGAELAASRVTNAAGEIAHGANQVLQEKLKDCIQAMTQCVADEFEAVYYALFSADLDPASVTPDFVRQRLTGAVNGYLQTLKTGGGVSDLVLDFLTSHSGQAVDAVMQYPLKNGKSLSSLLTAFSSGMGQQQTLSESVARQLTEALAQAPNAYLNQLEDEINAQVETWVSGLQDELTTTMNNGLQTLETEANERITSLTSEAAASVKSAVNNKLDAFFPKQEGLQMGGEAAGKAGLAAALKFDYTDYLRLLLFLGMLSDRDAILSRTADLVTLNVQKGITTGDRTFPVNKDFSMHRAYSYVSIQGDVEIKPFLLSNALVSRAAFGRPARAENLWTYSYRCIAGY